MTFVYKRVYLRIIKKHNNMQTDIREEIMELKIRKALCEHWNPKKAEMLEAAIQELINIYENKTETPRDQGIRHSRNRIRQIESGCE